MIFASWVQIIDSKYNNYNKIRQFWKPLENKSAIKT